MTIQGTGEFLSAGFDDGFTVRYRLPPSLYVVRGCGKNGWATWRASLAGEPGADVPT